MDTKELLSLLTARVQRFHLAPGGIPNITSDDISHALGMIQVDEARIYARVKYCGQPQFAEGVALAIRRHMLLKKADSSWRIPRKEFVLDMAYMLLAEAIDPNVCPWCVGRAEVRSQNVVITCDACRGSGRRKMRDIDHAKLLNIPRSSWTDPWKSRYRDLQIETVDKWEDMLAGAIRKRLSA